MRLNTLFAFGFLALLVIAAPQAQAQQLAKGQSAGASHAIASIVLPATPSYQWVAEHISASCATTPAAPITLNLKDGTTVIWSINMTGPISVSLADLSGTPGNSMTAAIADCGSNVTGTVNLVYKKQ